MANARSKAERSKAKDARQMPAGDEQKIRSKKKKRPKKEWKVIGPWPWPSKVFGREWSPYAGATKEQAEEWLEKYKRSHRGQRGEDWSLWRIEGPSVPLDSVA